MAAAAVYDAVVAGKSAAELRVVIEECAAGNANCEMRALGIEALRSAAVNTAGVPPGGGEQELPLAAARRLDFRSSICVLVEKGASVEPVFGESAGAEASVRALLDAGADPGAPVGIARERRSGLWRFERGGRTCTAAHLCVAPCAVFPPPRGVPRLSCLAALVHARGSGGGRGARGLINASDSDGLTPLAWLGERLSDPYIAASDATTWLGKLLQLRADPNRMGSGPLAAPPAWVWIRSADRASLPCLITCLRTLQAAGARLSGGVFDAQGDTPLIAAARRDWFGKVVCFLIDEAKVDVNEPNRLTGELPLTCCFPDTDTVAALLAAGADPCRADRRGWTPIRQAFSVMGGGYYKPRPGAPLALMRAGASLEGLRGPDGEPLFLWACAIWGPSYLSDDRITLLDELLRRTPEADRRATLLEDDSSAIDLLIEGDGDDAWLDEDGIGGNVAIIDLPLPPGVAEDDEDDDEAFSKQMDAATKRIIAAHRRLVVELVLSGVSVLEENEEAVGEVVQSALAAAARRGRRATRELAARRSESRRWRAHDCMVDLALEERDVREAEARLQATCARIAVLERAVEAAGASSTDDE